MIIALKRHTCSSMYLPSQFLPAQNDGGAGKITVHHFVRVCFSSLSLSIPQRQQQQQRQQS
jgi:hypothetical protein